MTATPHSANITNIVTVIRATGVCGPGAAFLGFFAGAGVDAAGVSSVRSGRGAGVAGASAESGAGVTATGCSTGAVGASDEAGFGGVAISVAGFVGCVCCSIFCSYFVVNYSTPAVRACNT